jgi:phosphoglycolate phosphatase-like HAD superfamily hydrolase
MTSGLIALDADGVLLDYSLAYAGAWEKAFGVYPRERNPSAYWPVDRWDVARLSGEHRMCLQNAFDEEFWAAIPPVKGALEACHSLSAAGYELVCVTALPPKWLAAREKNLRDHGFPITVVHATDNVATTASPKADTLNELRPLAFVDDFLPYFVGVDSRTHRALVTRGATGPPNIGELLVNVDSVHVDLLSFANWWLTQQSSVSSRCGAL